MRSPKPVHMPAIATSVVDVSGAGDTALAVIGLALAAAGVGLATQALSHWAEPRTAPLGLPVLAVAVGIYLPLELTSSIFVGGIIAVLLGFFIWRQWPFSGAWAIGVLVGIRRSSGLTTTSW